jgi:hypothetical protein
MTQTSHDERYVARVKHPAHWLEPYTGNYLYNHAALIEGQRSVLFDLKERLETQDQLTLAGALQIIDEMLKETID